MMTVVQAALLVAVEIVKVVVVATEVVLIWQEPRQVDDLQVQ